MCTFTKTSTQELGSKGKTTHRTSRKHPLAKKVSSKQKQPPNQKPRKNKTRPRFIRVETPFKPTEEDLDYELRFLDETFQREPVVLFERQPNQVDSLALTLDVCTLVRNPYEKTHRKWNKLGEGVYGSVWGTPSLPNVAVKVQCMDKVDDTLLEAFYRELAALACAVEHHVPGVVELHGAVAYGPLRVLILQRYDVSCSLFRANNPTCDQETYARIWRAVGAAVARLHELGIFHRDIHAGNVLVTGSTIDHLDVALADFGMAIFSEEGVARDAHAAFMSQVAYRVSVLASGSSAELGADPAAEYAQLFLNNVHAHGIYKASKTALSPKPDVKWHNNSNHIGSITNKTPEALIRSFLQDQRYQFGGTEASLENGEPHAGFEACTCLLHAVSTGPSVDAWAFAMSVGHCLGWKLWDPLFEGTKSRWDQICALDVLRTLFAVIGTGPPSTQTLPRACTKESAAVDILKSVTDTTGTCITKGPVDAWADLLPVGTPRAAAEFLSVALSLDPLTRCTDMGELMKMAYFQPK